MNWCNTEDTNILIQLIPVDSSEKAIAGSKVTVGTDMTLQELKYQEMLQIIISQIFNYLGTKFHQIKWVNYVCWWRIFCQFGNPKKNPSKNAHKDNKDNKEI